MCTTRIWQFLKHQAARLSLCVFFFFFLLVLFDSRQQTADNRCRGCQWGFGLRHGSILSRLFALMQEIRRRFVGLQVQDGTWAPMHRFAATLHQQTRVSRAWAKR